MKDKKLISELKLMKKLSGLMFESAYDNSDDIDYGDLAIKRKKDFISKIEVIFGPKLEFSGSADWGGIPVWSIKGGKYEGYFIIDDSEWQSDNAFSILKREFDEEKQENNDEVLFTAFVTPERYGDVGDGSLEELLNKASEIANQTDDNISENDDTLNSTDIPQNKKTINTKLTTKNGIKNAIYKVLNVEKVEGRYRDEYWAGIKKLTRVLSEIGADVELTDAKYEGRGEVAGFESLPTRKVYSFNISVRDKNGQMVTIPLKATCAFVGRTGTMSDDVYELTFYMP